MGASTLRRIASGILAGAVALAIIAPVFTAQSETNKAVTYLQNKTKNPWSIMALAAAGQTPSDLSSLTAVSGGAIDYEAPILALAAAGKDPRSFPATDYVAALKSKWDGSQLGDVGTVNDDIFGALAFAAAGLATTDPVQAGLKVYIPTKQNVDGGYPFSVGGTSDTNTTAAAIMALLELGVSSSDQAISKAVTYLKSAQNTDGGLPYDPQSPWGTESDASSDAWTIMAINKLGDSMSAWTKGGKTPMDHLLTLQDASGFFKYQATGAEDSFSPVTTSYAVIAALNGSLPVKKFVAPAAPHVTYRIAGRTSDYCSGEAYAANPLQLVKDVAASCGITYHVTHYAFGDFLDTIGNDVSGGNSGWTYMVNFSEAAVGADAYQLSDGDSVLWLFSDYGSKVTRLSVSGDVASGGAVTATVEYLDPSAGSGQVWKKLDNAEVHVASTVVNTTASGEAIISLPDGTYKLYAQKSGYVRSEPESVTFGAKTQNALDLSADLGGSGGGGGGDTGGSQTISFTLAAASGESSLGFGPIARGQTVSKSVVVNNRSSGRIYFEGLVSGDAVFTTYLTLAGTPWRGFSDRLDPAESKNVAVGLNVPADYSQSGVKNGKLTVWATASQ